MRVPAFLSFFLVVLCTHALPARAECSNWECDCTDGNVSEVKSRAECVQECGGASKVDSVTPPDCHRDKHAAADSFVQDAMLVKKAHDGNECSSDYIASECDSCNLEPRCTRKCIRDLGCD